MWDIADEKKKMIFERNKFIKRVNRILKLLRGSNLDEFRICFDKFKQRFDIHENNLYNKRYSGHDV